jgi:hypothetical protein
MPSLRPLSFPRLGLGGIGLHGDFGRGSRGAEKAFFLLPFLVFQLLFETLILFPKGINPLLLF